MKTVNILIDNSKIVTYLISPIRYNKSILNEMGCKINFFYKPSKSCFSCDILLLVSKTVLSLVQEKKVIITEPSPTIELIKKAKQYANKVVWLDSSDSTTVTHFELLPYIDLYLKKQLLVDKSLYGKNFVGGRIFTDFYNSRFNIRDDVLFKQFFPPDPKLLFKVDLSWNIGLGDMFKAFTKTNTIQRLFLKANSTNYKINFTSPRINKENDIFIRTTSNLERKLVAFHRQELVARLQKIIDSNQLSGSTKGKWLTTKEFRKALTITKILPSPFGWGEIGVRDFEAFIFGAALLKPDMQHLETWPYYFINDKTYCSFNWDFSDLENKIKELLDSEEKRLQIAFEGQDVYRKSISDQGMIDFCKWFISKIEC